MQLGQGVLAVAPQILGCQVFGQKQLEPVQHLAGRGFLLQPRCFAQLVELGQRRGQQRFLDAGEMHIDDAAHGFGVGKADEMEKAAPQEGIGQFFFIVRGDDHHGPVPGRHGFARLVDVELHAVQFLQQVIGKFDVGLVDLVDQQHHAALGGEGLPQLAAPDIVGDIVNAGIAELAVTQPADGIVFVQALLRLGGAFHMPFKDGQTQTRGDLPGEFGLARARLSLHQKGAFKGDGRVDRDGQVGRRNIPVGRGKMHDLPKVVPEAGAGAERLLSEAYPPVQFAASRAFG